MTEKPSPHGDATEPLKNDASGPGIPASMDDFGTLVRRVVVGRIDIVDGPGKGRSLDVFRGVNSIGRSATRNVIAIPFGDSTIHREHHCFVEVSNSGVVLHDNGKVNAVRLNGVPVRGPVTLSPDDLITIGNTQLKYSRL